MAITAWAGKGLKQFDLLIGERTNLLTSDDRSHRLEHPLEAIGATRAVRVPRCDTWRGLASGNSVSNRCQDHRIWIVCRLKNGPPTGSPKLMEFEVYFRDWHRAIIGHLPAVTVDTEDQRIGCLAQPRGIFGNQSNTG